MCTVVVRLSVSTSSTGPAEPSRSKPKVATPADMLVSNGMQDCAIGRELQYCLTHLNNVYLFSGAPASELEAILSAAIYITTLQRWHNKWSDQM